MMFCEYMKGEYMSRIQRKALNKRRLIKMRNRNPYSLSGSPFVELV